MSDIDFDELDRAVNGALGSDTPAPELTVDIPEPTETPTIEHVERTVLNPTTPEVKAPVAPAPAARRSSGRFMDMVHPSSDMRGPAGSVPADNKPQVIPTVEPVTEELKEVETSAWNEPLESPFLPDAKVEKRPLGGGEPATETNSAANGFDFQGLLDEPKEELLEAPEPQERLEATSMPDPIDFAAANAITPEIESQPIEAEEPVKIEETPVTETVEEVSAEPEIVAEPVQPVAEEPVGPTSITPQYKEQPSSNQESGAMYDTESYHQPVAQPVKKKSSWFTFMWIIILVLLGAAAGWAVYTYVLPTL
jgi:hypothetical protein